MAYLLMFVTLLHLITLAMLFIATMEKVVIIFGTWCLFVSWVCKYPAVCVMSDLSLKSWWEWDGMENSDLWYNCRFDNFTETWLCASSKETGKAPFHFVHLHKSGFTWTGEIWELTLVMYVGMFSQSGSRQCRSWWSSLWSSPRSPFWCSWVNCSPCPRVDFSTSPGCVKSSQVTVECNNVPPTLICAMRSFEMNEAWGL